MKLFYSTARYDQVIIDLLRTEFEVKHVGRFRELAHVRRRDEMPTAVLRTRQ